MTTDLTRASAAELADLLTSGGTSSVEVTQAHPRPHRRRRRRRPRLPPRRPRRRPRERARHRRATQPRRAAAPARRRADRRQGRHGDQGPADDLRQQDPRGLGPALRRDRRDAPARGRHAHPRQDQHGRVRDGLLDRALGLRPDAQPVGPRPHPRRFRWWLERGRRVVPGAARDRHRHRWLDPPAGRRHRHRRDQADLRRRLALRPRRARLLARPGRAVRPHRARRGPAARGHGRPRPDGLDLDRRAGPGRRRGGPSRRRQGHADRHRPRARRRGLPGRCPGALRRVGPAPRRRRRRGRRGLVPELHRGPRGLLPHPPDARPRATSRSSTPCATACASCPRASTTRAPSRSWRPRATPASATRSSAASSSAPTPCSSGYYDAYYGSAQKVRAPHRRRLRRGVRDGRRARLARPRRRRRSGSATSSTTRWPCTSTTSPRSRPTSRASPACRCPSGLADEDGLPAGFQILAPATGRRPPVLPWAPLSSSASSTAWGGPLLDQAPELSTCRLLRREPDMSTATTDADHVLRRGLGLVRPGHGPRGPRRARTPNTKMFCGCADRVRRRAQHAGLPGLPRAARRAAGRQREGRRVGDPDRARAQLRDRAVVPVRAQELLLPGHAEELPDLAVRRADRLRGLPRRRARRRRDLPRRDRARAHGGGHRQVAARRRLDRPHPRRRLLARRLQPRRHPAHRDRHQAAARCGGARRPRSPGPTSRRCATCCGARRLRRQDGAGLDALRRQRLAHAQGLDDARHPHRDQERQLAALGRAGRPLRDLPPRRRSSSGGGSILQETRHWHEDTGVTTSGRVKSDADDYRYFPEPDLVPVAPSRETVEAAARPPCPSRRPSAAGGSSPTGASATSRCATSLNAGLVELIEETVEAGATPAGARKWWSGEIARRANAEGRADVAAYAAERSITPAHVVELEGLVTAGRLNDSMARQVLEGVLDGEGTPTEVADARGPRARPGRRRPRGGRRRGHRRQPRRRRRRSATARCQAAGALIGQVMKEMKGQADAGKAREIILAKLTS